jgi:hypothetical protein
MLPTGHVEFTWAALNAVQRKTGLFREADYRLVALAALAPDLLDKPLALTLYRDSNAALFWGHNVWLHLGVWLTAWAFASRRSRVRSHQLPSSSGFVRLLPYLLAFSCHLLGDRMWGFRESLFYPLGAGYWHPWVHVGEPAAMLAAYLDIVRTTPILVVFEVAGLALFCWFVVDRRLWRPLEFRTFVATGRPLAGPSPRTFSRDGNLLPRLPEAQRAERATRVERLQRGRRMATISVSEDEG